MIYQYSNSSRQKLEQCHPLLQQVFKRVIQICDCTILTGHRDKPTQNEMYRTGKSHVKWPNGKHNTIPSQAIDAAAYPIDWKDRERATLFAGLVLGIAEEMGIKLRWGGDWNSNWQVKDNNFDDLWHFELDEFVDG